MIPDKKIAMLVDIGSVLDEHLRGRAREGKPVRMQLRADERDLVDKPVLP